VNGYLYSYKIVVGPAKECRRSSGPPWPWPAGHVGTERIYKHPLKN
jgi:hypothetical protein